jgi:tRNA dimethylallyltransferase
MVEKLNIAINQFSKRQLTWFKRWAKQGAKINWLKDDNLAAGLVKKFIKKRS